MEVVKEVVFGLLALLRSFWVAVVVASDFACAELLMPLSPRQVLLFVVELVSDVTGGHQCKSAAFVPVVALDEVQLRVAFSLSRRCVVPERALMPELQLVVLAAASEPELPLLVPLLSAPHR